MSLCGLLHQSAWHFGAHTGFATLPARSNVSGWIIRTTCFQLELGIQPGKEYKRQVLPPGQPGVPCCGGGQSIAAAAWHFRPAVQLDCVEARPERASPGSDGTVRLGGEKISGWQITGRAPGFLAHRVCWPYMTRLAPVGRGFCGASRVYHGITANLRSKFGRMKGVASGGLLTLASWPNKERTQLIAASRSVLPRSLRLAQLSQQPAQSWPGFHPKLAHQIISGQERRRTNGLGGGLKYARSNCEATSTNRFHSSIGGGPSP